MRPEQPISRILFPHRVFTEAGNDHSSLDDSCRSSLATYPGARTGRSQTPPYLVLHRVGFTKLLRSPEELVRSYRTFSPLPETPLRSGGILSVALSFTSPRLHVMEHPALRCSDFPPGYPWYPAIVWTAPAFLYRLSELCSAKRPRCALNIFCKT
jgi:hypothetical protein